MSEGPMAEGEEPTAQGPRPEGKPADAQRRGTASPRGAGTMPGLLALAAAAASILVYFTPPIWGLALPISSIAMVLGLIGMLSNSPTIGARIMALLALVIGVIMTVIVAVHLIQLPVGR
jgi:hypothetical protein